MKRRIPLALGIAAAGLAVLVLGTALKRVPEGQQALRVYRNGATRTYGPGVHWAPPLLGEFIRYPAGPTETRIPREGAFTVIMGSGAEVDVVFEARIDLSTGEPSTIYRRFGRDFDAALGNIVKEAAEIHAARVTGPVTVPPSFTAAVREELLEALESAGIALRDFRLAAIPTASGRTAPPSVAAGSSPLRKVIVVGVDGADWPAMRPLMEAGLLPNIRAVVEGGATGPLRSVEPLLSPLLWTTMATGKLPEEHGILNFTIFDPKSGKKVPITRLYRKVDAFWNMLDDFGRTVDVVGWLATYPAEDVNGVIVTDRVGYLAYADTPDDTTLLRGSVSPARRIDDVSRLVRKSTSVTYEEIQPFLHIGRETFEKNKRLPFDPRNPINNMIMLYATTETYRAIANFLLDERRPDVLAVYFELVDATGHLFMPYAPPRQSHIDASKYDQFKDAVKESYRLQDRIIGELMARCDDRTVLMIVSDHGFKSGARRPKMRPEIWAGKAAFWHDIDGIICLFGNGVRRGIRIEDASILDVAPSILALAGLPKPGDMPGKVLIEALEDSLAARLNPAAVATLQRARKERVTALPGTDAISEEAMKKLEALGYITPDNPDAHNNLGQRLQEQGEYEKAIEEFKKALAINPNFPGALNNIGVCYGKLRRHDQAEVHFKRALALKPDDVYAMNNLAIMYMELGDFENARRFGEKSVSIEPNYANGHLTLGSIYANMGEFELARGEFLKTLEIEPSNRMARLNLDRLQSSARPNE